MKPLLLGCGIAGHRELVHRRAGDENEVVARLHARLQAAVARLDLEFWLHRNDVGCAANHIAFAELLELFSRAALHKDLRVIQFFDESESSDLRRMAVGRGVLGFVEMFVKVRAAPLVWAVREIGGARHLSLLGPLGPGVKSDGDAEGEGNRNQEGAFHSQSPLQKEGPHAEVLKKRAQEWEVEAVGRFLPRGGQDQCAERIQRRAGNPMTHRNLPSLPNCDRRRYDARRLVTRSIGKNYQPMDGRSGSLVGRFAKRGWREWSR